MALLGVMKRGCDDPTLQITINDTDGSAYDLTDCKVKIICYVPTTLAVSVNDSTTTIPIAGAMLGILQNSDYLMVDVGSNLIPERMRITAAGAPTTLNAGNADCTVEARPYSIPAAAAVVYGSAYVAGAGSNTFVLSNNATFNIGYDGNAVQACTVAAADTATNYLIAHLVADVQASVNTALAGAHVTVGNIGNKLIFTSNTTGTGSQVKITAPDAYATAELGISAVEDWGEATVATAKYAHTTGAVVNIIKWERDAEIYSATTGVVRYPWRVNDTSLITSLYFEIEVQTKEGLFYKLPSNSTDTIYITVIADSNARIIGSGV